MQINAEPKLCIEHLVNAQILAAYPRTRVGMVLRVRTNLPGDGGPCASLFYITEVSQLREKSTASGWETAIPSSIKGANVVITYIGVVTDMSLWNCYRNWAYRRSTRAGDTPNDSERLMYKVPLISTCNIGKYIGRARYASAEIEMEPHTNLKFLRPLDQPRPDLAMLPPSMNMVAHLSQLNTVTHASILRTILAPGAPIYSGVCFIRSQIGTYYVVNVIGTADQIKTKALQNDVFHMFIIPANSSASFKKIRDMIHRMATTYGELRTVEGINGIDAKRLMKYVVAVAAMWPELVQVSDHVAV